MTDKAIHVKWRLIEATVERRDLDRIVQLIDDGAVRLDNVTPTSDCRTLISDEHPTTAIAMLQDLGYI